MNSSEFQRAKNRLPRVSIIMPTYDWSSVLPYSIGSVLLQDFADFELLVVGDGCTDDSQAVVEAIDDERVRWIGLERNSGHQSVPNNAGLAAARGSIIAYIGHDDLWLPGHLSNLLSAIDAGADMAVGATLWVPDGETPNWISLPEGLEIPPSSVAHRKAVTDQVGNWPYYRDVVTYPESDLWQRIDAAGLVRVRVPRLSVIKFPAGLRRNVYRERPCREQALWLERIRQDPDLAARIPLEMSMGLTAPRRMPYRQLVRVFWIETRRRFFHRLTRSEVKSTRPGEAIDHLRKIKGLAPAPQRPVDAPIKGEMK